MIDWLTILLALSITAILVGIFGFVACKINVSDPLVDNMYGKKDDSASLSESISERSRKDKSAVDSRKQKRKEKKKTKVRTKADDSKQHSVSFVEPTQDSSDDTDDEREESEQESTPPRPVEEVQVKSRKKNKDKARQPSPVLPARLSTSHVEGILVNKSEKSPVTAHPQPMAHPKLALMIPKDEVALAKQHQQQAQNQPKQNPSGNVGAPKKTANSVNAVAPEQPFTKVVSNRSKGSTPPIQQPTQQTNKPVASSAPVVTQALTNASPIGSIPNQVNSNAQQKLSNGVSQEALPQRQPIRAQQAPVQVNGLNGSAVIAKPVASAPSTTPKPPTKFTDLVKTLPNSQAVVIELMSIFDAYPLTVDELNIVMHKIANKQVAIKQEWSKLQHGQKFDPQAHIGQVLDESVKAYEEDVKTNPMKRINDLTDELHNERRRINDLLKEKTDKDAAIQSLRNQLDSFHHQQPGSNQINAQQQNQYHALQLEVQRLSDENVKLNSQLIQQQPLTSTIYNSANGLTHPQIEVMAGEVKRLAMVNSSLEKQIKANEDVIKKSQEAKENTQRANQKLIQDIQDLQKQLQTKDDKLIQELNDTRTRFLNQKVDYERRLEQLEIELKKFHEREKLHLDTVANASSGNSFDEERDKFEADINQFKQTIESLKHRLQEQEQYHDQFKTQLINENNQLKNDVDQIRIQFETKEINLRQELEHLKNENVNLLNQQNESNQSEITGKNVEINSLQIELEKFKTENETFRVEHEQIKARSEVLDGELAQLKTTNDNLLAELEQIKSQNQTLRFERDENKPENENLRAELVQIQAANAVQQTELEQIKQQKDILQTELEQLKPKAEALQAELDNVKPQSEAFQAELDHFKSKSETLQAELEQVKPKAEALQTELDQFKSKSETLQAELEQVKPKAEVLQTELDQFKSKSETLQAELEQVKPKAEALQTELDQFKSKSETLQTELGQYKPKTEALQAELEQAKTQYERLRVEFEQGKLQNDGASEQIEQRLRHEHDKYKQFLLDLLPADVRSSLVDENQDLEQWLSSYRETHQAKIESEKASLQEECNSLKRENERLQQTMDDIESQLREIEQTVQTKEELLVAELNNKSVSLDRAREENGRLNTELQRVHKEAESIRHDYDKALNEMKTFKSRVADEPVLLNSALANITDELSDFMRQSSPPEIDTRAEELNELIRASKEALANQDSIVQQLDKRIDDLHPGAIGEVPNDVENLPNETSNNQQPEQDQNS